MFPMTTPRHILNLVIGTAGHIDHGKSTLVERLTGRHPDTLKEEIERGLTINLGYATLSLPDGRKVGIIDVPGHERFIKNMVAGATGVQFVVFVIAADDSIMPQTREHLDILRILGVRRGVVALTKIDLVDEETVEIACEEIRDFVRGSFLEGAPIFPVSAVDGTGLDALQAHLVEALGEISIEYLDRPFRLPVQRTFSASGYGTVVTGVPVSGRVRVGDTLEILPQGTTSRVRGLEAYGERIEEAEAGHRTAVNFSDADYRTVIRGNVAAAPGCYRASRILEARLEYLAGNAKPLRHRAPVRLLTGTVETVGKVVLLDRKEVAPGERAILQLFLQDPVAAAEGDRYILRTISPMTTIGGGVLLGHTRSRLRRFRPWTLEHLERKERAAVAGDPVAFLAEVVFGYGRTPVGAAELGRDAHRGPAELADALARLAGDGTLVAVGGGRGYLHAEMVERLREEVVEAIRRGLGSASLSVFVPVREVARAMKLESGLLDEILALLEQRGAICRGPQGRLGLPGHRPKLTAKQEETRSRIEALFREGFLAPPGRGDVAQRAGAGKDEALRMIDLLLDEGAIVRLKEDTLLHREAVEEAGRRLAEALGDKGRMTASEIRDLLGTSRKFLIPLLEHFDQTGLTVREGDFRTLPEGGAAREG